MKHMTANVLPFQMFSKLAISFPLCLSLVAEITLLKVSSSFRLITDFPSLDITISKKCNAFLSYQKGEEKKTKRIGETGEGGRELLTNITNL